MAPLAAMRLKLEQVIAEAPVKACRRVTTAAAGQIVSALAAKGACAVETVCAPVPPRRLPGRHVDSVSGDDYVLAASPSRKSAPAEPRIRSSPGPPVASLRKSFEASSLKTHLAHELDPVVATAPG